MAGPSYPNGVDPNATPTTPAAPAAAPDYQANYWAQDRPQVLASMGLTDTSGKVWNGSSWAAPTAGAAPANQPGQSGPWNGAGVPAGFDATKWNDPTKNDPKYDVGHMVASGWGNDQISQWMQSHPQEFAGYNVTGKDTITDAQGNIFDFRLGMGSDPNGQGTAQWTAVGGPGGGGSSPSGINGAPTNLPYGAQTLGGNVIGNILGGNGGGYSGSSSSFSGYNLPGMGGLPSTAAGDLYGVLGQRAGQSLNINTNDPIIRNQVDAFNAQQTRANRNYLADLAEKEGPNANLNEESRMVAENAGQQGAQFQATLMQNELNARRQEISQALSGQMGMLSDQQKIALQQQLGYIDAALRQQSITNQNNQFVDQMGLNASQQANYWDALRSGLLG